MKQVLIQRYETSDLGTFGNLFIDDRSICVTGELPLDYDNDGILNESRKECIPAGTYEVIPRPANEVATSKFKYPHYILQNVPSRSYVLMHKGNFCGNVDAKDDEGNLMGYKSDILGCILVGKEVGILFNGIKNQKAVVASGEAWKLLISELGQNKFTLTIENNDNLLTQQ